MSNSLDPVDDWEGPSLGQLIASRREALAQVAAGTKPRQRHVLSPSQKPTNNNNKNLDTTKLKKDKQTSSPTTTKASKQRPRELPSNRPVPVGRDMCIGNERRHMDITGEGMIRSVRRFDPRFEDHCGELRDGHVERNYGFLAERRESRREELERLVTRLEKDKKRKKKDRKTKNDEINEEQVRKELDRIRQGDLRREATARRRQVEKEMREEQKEAVRQGKKAFFFKRSELRERENRSRFEDIKKRKGGVKKFIAKQRKKIVSKERRMMRTKET